MGRTAQPDSLRHRRLRMTGTEPHAPRGTAGRGPNWDPGPSAGHAGAARRCTKRHRRLWAQPGPWAVHGPRELRVDACTSRHRRPRDPLGIAGEPLGTAGRERAGGAARLGVDLHVYACPPWHCRPRDPQGDRGLRAGRRSCVTRNGHVDVEWPARSPEWPARSPRSQDWSRCRRRRDVHASTRSSRGPCTANGPGRAHSRRCRLIVQRRAAPAWSARGPRSQLGPRPAVPRGACGSVPVMRSRRRRSESGFRAVRYGQW